MESKQFLTSEDRHDLFEKIKAISPNSEMINNDVQDLLNTIDEKFYNRLLYIYREIISKGSELNKVLINAILDNDENKLDGVPDETEKGEGI